MRRTTGFRFDLQRAIQAAGVVLRDRGPMDRIRLLKILYLASRDALKETGKPIIGGRAFALDNGPLHSEVYNQIKGDANDAEWRQYFVNKSHTVELIEDPGRLDLSPYEIDLLNRTAEWADQFDTFDLSENTHNLPEWQKNKPSAHSSKLIHVDDILEALGFTHEEAREIIASQTADDEFVEFVESQM